jgi:hypothetical protein
MAITTTRAGLVIDKIVAGCKLLPVFADPARVFDGPFTGGDTMWTSAAFIGFDGDWRLIASGESSGAEYEAFLVNQEDPYLGVSSVYEQIELRCCATSWSGESDLSIVRNTTLAMWAGVADMLRTDPSLGIDGSTKAILQTGTGFYYYDSDGNANCRIPFVIHVTITLMTV